MLRNTTLVSGIILIMLIFVTQAEAEAGPLNGNLESAKQLAKSAMHTPSWEETFLSENAPNYTKTHIFEQAWEIITQAANEVLKKASKTKDGAVHEVTCPELATAIENHAFSGLQAQLAASMYDNFDLMQNIPGCPVSASISEVNVKRLAESMLAMNKRLRGPFIAETWTLEDGLTRFSPEHCGAMSLLNLTEAQKSPDASADDRASLAELSANFQAIAHENVIRAKDVKLYIDHIKADDPDYLIYSEFMVMIDNVKRVQKSPNAQCPFRTPKSPIEDIVIDAVTQGHSPDCCFKSSLAGLTLNRPKDVLRMIKVKNKDETLVTFPGDVSAITVANPTDEEAAMYSRQCTYGNWPTIIENAYGQRSYNALPPSKQEEYAGQFNEEKAGIEKRMTHALQTITGHHVAGIADFQFTEDTLRDELQLSQQEHLVVIFGTDHKKIPDQKTKDGYAMDHVFTFVEIDDNDVVTVRNPRLDKSIAIIKVPLNRMLVNFDAYAFETRHPPSYRPGGH